MNTENFRYQVYSLKDDGSVNKPLTIPFERKDIALSYYNECVSCALVMINQCGSIVEILEKNLDFMCSQNILFKKNLYKVSKKKT